MDAVAKMGKMVRETAELHRRPRLHRRGQAGGILQRAGGQPLYGGRLPRPGRAGLCDQRRRFRPRRGARRSCQSSRATAISREIADIIKKTAFKITRMGQLVAPEASQRLCVPFGIVDLSLAPTPAIGDSRGAYSGGDGA